MTRDKAIQHILNLHAEEEDPMMKNIWANILADFLVEQVINNKEDDE